jgi:uncharacterized protein YecT (DUF1311 family)
MKAILFLGMIIIVSINCFSQGGIDHIKNQPYMKLKGDVDCNSIDGDNLSEKICVNLAYQKSDSLLVIAYKKLLQKQASDTERNKFISIQKDWRQFRDKHCAIVWDSYKGGSLQSTFYLRCLTELTDNRRKELESLLEDFE